MEAGDARLLRHAAKSLHADLRGTTEKHYESGLRRLLPWPELRAPPCSVNAARVRDSKLLFTFSCIGRESVSMLQEALLGCFKLDRRMLIGTLGSGKTHLLALTVCSHYQLHQQGLRVAAIFTMPRTLTEAFVAVQRALLVAFGDQDESLDAILSLPDSEALIRFVERCRTPLAFVVDAWNEADRNSDVQKWLERVLNAATGYLQGTTSVRDSRSIRQARDEIHLYSGFTNAEFVDFLIFRGVYIFGPEDRSLLEFLEHYTGRVPLFLSIFCKCYEKVRGRPSHEALPEMERLFRAENEVAEMEASIANCHSRRLSEFIESGVYNVKQWILHAVHYQGGVQVPPCHSLCERAVHSQRWKRLPSATFCFYVKSALRCF